MMTLTLFLRSRLLNLISSRSKRSPTKFLLFLLGLNPTVRAARLAQQGDITASLGILDKKRRRLKEAERLYRRLADMHAYLQTPSPELPSTPEHSRIPFNGHVLYALHSCGAFDPSGYSSRSVSLINAVRSEGVSPIVCVRPGYPWDLQRHESKGRCRFVDYRGIRFRLFPDPCNPFNAEESSYIAHYSEMLQQTAEAEAVGIIHSASNYLNGIASALAAKRMAIPSVYEVRGLWHLTRAFSNPDYAHSEHYRYCELRELEACRRVDHVITISRALKLWLVERGIPAERISVIANAAAAPSSNPVEQREIRRSVRRRHSIPEDATLFGYLGAIVEYEGLDEVAAALARTQEGRRPFLLIGGSGAFETRLRALVKKLRISDSVRFVGRVDPQQVSEYYFAMDAAIFARKDAALTRLVPPLKPYEVLAHGKTAFISPALAEALGTTSLPGISVIDIASVESLADLAFSRAAPRQLDEVPDWAGRARELISLYRFLGVKGAAQLEIARDADTQDRPPHISGHTR